MNELAYILVGVLIGTGLVRYGIGLGYKMREDEPLNATKDLPIEQETTELVSEDEYLSQEETEVL
jgi:hypothetical protein